MRKNMKKIIALLLSLVLCAAFCVGCSGKKGEDGKLKIVTTIYPLYEWVKNITDGVQNADTTLLLSKGADMHSFQPTSKDIVTISDCDVFVYVGGESDKWVEDILNNARNKDMLCLNLMDALGSAAKEEETVEGMQAEQHDEGEESDEKEYDEHIWLSLKNASALCRHIADKLGEKDNADKATFDSNASSYIAKLDALDGQYAQAIKESKNDTLIFADRFPFRYLTNDYGLHYYAAFAGCSAESEASFKTLVFLADKLKELHLTKLMTIDGSDQKIARSVIDTAGIADVKVLTLNSMQSDSGTNGSYLTLMEQNLSVLKEALN